MKAAWMLTAMAVTALLLGCQNKEPAPKPAPEQPPPQRPMYPTEQIPAPEPQPEPAAVAPAPATPEAEPPAVAEDEEPALRKPAAEAKPRANTRTRERETAAAAPKAKRTHTVKKGETLQEISQKYYGTTKHYMAIAKANNIKNVNKLKVGTKLVIPDIK